MKFSLFRRRPSEPEPQPVPPPAAEPFALLTGIPEAHIAVGSLSGVPPSEIEDHLLIVVDRDGRARVSGSACPHMAALMLAEMSAAFARQAYAEHERGPS